MVEERVIINVLAPADQRDAIEHGFGARAGENDIQIVAADRASKTGRMGKKVRRPTKVHLGRADVIRRDAFLLHLAMLDACAVTDDDFRDGVGEINPAVQSGVCLDDRRLRRVIGHHQDARMGDCRLAARRGKKQQVDRQSSATPRGIWT